MNGRELFAYAVTATDAETGELRESVIHTYWSPNRRDSDGERLVSDQMVADAFAAEITVATKRKHFGVAAAPLDTNE